MQHRAPLNLRLDRTVGGKIENATTAAAVPKEYLPDDAKERFVDGSDGLRGHMPGHSGLLEILASKYHYLLNGCSYGDESVLVALVRVLGWGSRVAFFLSSLVFLALAVFAETNPIGKYTFSRERDAEGVLRNDDTDAFEWYVYLVYGVWCVSVFTEVLSYIVGRAGGGKELRTHDGQCSALPFLFCNRVSVRDDDGEGGACLVGLVLMVWFLGLGAAALAAVHTFLSHTFVTRNVYFAWLFLLFLLFTVLSTLADAVSLGGIDGLAVQNRVASQLAAFRVVVVVPVLVIFSLFAAFMCSPPWDSF